jgi:hypothetical protein
MIVAHEEHGDTKVKTEIKFQKRAEMSIESRP